MRRIKILYVVSTLMQGGPTNQLLGIVSNLDRSVFAPRVLTLSPESAQSKKNEFIQAHLEVDSLLLSRLGFPLQGLRLLRRYIEQYRPDIVHTSGVRADMVVAKLSLKPLHYLTVRNYAYDDYVALYGRLLGGWAARSSIAAMQQGDYVVCCSNSLKDMYARLLTKQLYVIQNGVDTYKYQPPASLEAKLQRRAELGLRPESMIFLVAGPLIKRKDPLTIIEAFNQAKVAGKAVLVFMGDGNLMAQCRRAAGASILFPGQVPNVPDYMQAADVYVSAAESEGLPNAVLEAGSCGLSMILSDIPQHREIYAPNPGLVDTFRVGHASQLAAAMARQVSSFKPGINRAMAEHIQANFDVTGMSRQYARLYLVGVRNEHEH